MQGTVQNEAADTLPVESNIGRDPMQAENSLPRLTPNVLQDLLKKSEYGKDVLSNRAYVLSDPGRKLVVDIVARYHIARNRKTSSAEVSDLSDVIIELFPKETKVHISLVKISLKLTVFSYLILGKILPSQAWWC